MVGGESLRPVSWMATSISRQSGGCRSESQREKWTRPQGRGRRGGCGWRGNWPCCLRQTMGGSLVLFKTVQDCGPTRTCALLTRAGIRQELTGSIPATSVALANPAASRLNGRRSSVRSVAGIACVSSRSREWRPTGGRGNGSGRGGTPTSATLCWSSGLAVTCQQPVPGRG